MTTSNQHKPRALMISLTATGVVVAGLALWQLGPSSAPTAEPAVAEPAASGSAGAGQGRASGRPGSASGPDAAEPAPHPRAADEDSKANRDADARALRDRTRARIWYALRQRHRPPSEPDSAEPDLDLELPLPLPLPPLDPEYIRSALSDQLVPVAVECYDSALEDEPELSGALLVDFTIVGAEEVGGVVEEATIREDSTLDNAFVRDCIRESVLAVTFDPPPEGGRIQVTFPLRFEPEAS